jgi:hypothetical protein
MTKLYLDSTLVLLEFLYLFYVHIKVSHELLNTHISVFIEHPLINYRIFIYLLLVFMNICTNLIQTFVLRISDSLLNLVLQVLKVISLLLLVNHFYICVSCSQLDYFYILIGVLGCFELKSVFFVRLDEGLDWTLVLFHGNLKNSFAILI